MGRKQSWIRDVGSQDEGLVAQDVQICWKGTQNKKQCEISNSFGNPRTPFPWNTMDLGPMEWLGGLGVRCWGGWVGGLRVGWGLGGWCGWVGGGGLWA